MSTAHEVRRSCWCGSDTAKRSFTVRFGEGHTFHYIRCQGCGVFLLYPQPDAPTLHQFYAAEYYGVGRRKFARPLARLVDWFQGGRARYIRRHVPHPSASGHHPRLLDVGCGNGGFLLQARQLGFHAEGTEWTPESAARAQVHPRIPIHVGDLLELELPRSHFDAITLWHVFEHLPRPLESLREIRDLLRPGGHLFLSLPNHESTQARRYGRHWFHLDPPRHLFGFGPRSMETLLAAAGFDLLRLHTWSLEQNPYGEIQSRLNSRGLPRDRAYNVLKRTSTEPAAIQAMELLRLGAWTLPALFRSTLEAAAGRGATMTLVATPRPATPTADPIPA